MSVEKLKVIATSAVTWLTLASILVQGFIDELGPEFPSLVEPAARTAAFLGGVVLIIRRVSPVDVEDRGLV